VGRVGLQENRAEDRRERQGHDPGEDDGHGHREAELAGTGAVDIDVERWEVRRLRKFQIAQERQLCHLCLYLAGVDVIVLQANALDGDFDGRGRAEAQDLGHDITGFEGYLQFRQLLFQSFTQFFA